MRDVRKVMNSDTNKKGKYLNKDTEGVGKAIWFTKELGYQEGRGISSAMRLKEGE